MIDGWYFCCCLELPLRRASPFLAMLDALSGGDGVEMATRAVAQLRKTDIWMRLYASRRCLELLDKYPGGALGIQVRELIQELAATLDGKEAATARRALDLCLDGNLDEATLGDLCRLAAVTWQPHKRSGRQHPYVELREQRLATLTMLSFAHAVRKDPRRWKGVLETESVDCHSIKEFLRQAAEGCYGRLAFLCSLQAAGATETIPTDVLIAKLKEHSELGASEPDLLMAYAELCFGPNSAKEMMTESVTFTKLRRWAGEQLLPLNPVLPEELEIGRRPLHCILWQCVLWEMAAQASPKAAIPFLPDLWAPPGTEPATPILAARLPKVQTPDPVRSYASWMLALRHITVKGPKGKYEQARLDFAPLGDDESFAWTCYSPWLRHRSAHMDMRGSEYLYPESQKRPLLLRLLWASVTATRIVSFQDSSAAATDGTKAAAALLIHAFDVMHEYRQWLNALDTPRAAGAGPELPLHLTLLMLLAKARVLRCVRTTLEHPAPELFLEARGRLADHKPGAKDVRAFCGSAAPAVLVQWVLDAFVAAVDDSGPGRWIEASTAISDIALASQIPSPKKIDALLLQRFFGDGEYEVPIEFDWREGVTDARARSGWEVAHRKLLLLPDLPPWEWDRPEWPEPSFNDGNGEEPSRDPMADPYFVRAIERRASIGNGSQGEQAFPASWKNEWLKKLRSIATPVQLDPLVRVRLAEMLQDSELKLNEQEQIAICAALVEWGNLYELVGVFEEVFDLEATGALKEAADLGLPRKRARAALLFASAQFVHTFRVEEALRGDEEPANPYELAEREEKVRLIESFLRPVAAQGAWSGGDTTLSGELAELQLRRLKESARTDALFEREYIVGPRGAYLEGSGIPPSWSVTAAAFDANTETVAAVHTPYSLDGAVDLFTDKGASISDFDRMKGDERRRLLGIVIHDKSARRTRSFVNSGIKTLLVLPDELETRFADGTPILFEPEKVTPADGRSYWQAKPAGEMTEVSKLRARHTRVMVRVEYTGNPIWSVPGVFEVGSKQLTVSASDWNPAFYRSESAEKVEGIIAEFGADKRWKPVAGDLLELLTREFPGRESGAAALRFVREIEELSGQAKWQFMTKPGLIYNLAPGLFSDDAQKMIEAAIEAEQDPTGLEFAVWPVYEAKGKTVKLALRAPAGGDPVRRDWIDWSNAFEGADYIEVERRGELWHHTFRDPIGRYPKSVRVLFTRNPPKSSPAYGYVDSWDPKKGVLRAVFEERRLNVRGDRQPFVEKWLTLRCEDRLQLSRTFGRVDPIGYVRGVTVEDAGILVEAESLSFGFDGGIRVDHRPRQVSVIWIDRWRPIMQVELDSNALPVELAALENGEGIVAAVQTAEDTSSVPVEIWWRLAQGIVPHRLPLPFKPGLFPGARAEFVRLNDSIKLSVSTRNVRARALWQESSPLDQGMLFLGRVQLDRNEQCIAETGAGYFCFVDSEMEAPHLSSVHMSPEGGWLFDGPGLSADQRVVNSSKSQAWPEGKFAYRRAVFTTPKGALTGICDARSSTGTSTVRPFMWAWQHDDGLWDLRRFFEFVPSRADSRASSQANDAKLWQDRLDEYFEKPRDLTIEALEGGKVRLNHLRIPIPDMQSGGTVWTPDVPVGAGEGPHISRASYPRTGKAALYRTPEGQYRVSFRRSEPMDPAAYAKHLCAQMDVKTPLKNLLRYVGPIKGEAAVRHRFEWSLGYVLEADESDLRYEDGPFKNTRGILFHGDGVRSIRFGRDTETQRMIISFEEVNLEYSVATRLYLQSLGGVVHLLSIKLEGDHVAITAILGSVESDMASSQEYTAPDAVLDNASERRLFARLGANTGTDERNRILGRLDKHAFENSFGEEIVFRHVKMTFQTSPGVQVLKEGDFVFLRAGIIKALSNDVGVEMEPYGLVKEDIGPDFRRGCLLLRREYSCREENLPQLLKREGPKELEGELYLARVYNRQDGNVGASLTDTRTPTRRESVLLSLISDSKSPWLAVVVDAKDRVLHLEVKAGVHFRLKAASVRLPAERLTKGTILRLQSHGDSFSAVVARFPDDKYIGNGVREVVCLPKNTLLDPKLPFEPAMKQPNFWNRTMFTIANLPGIEAKIGAIDVQNNRWYPPNAVEGQKLMRNGHPKVATLGKDSKGELRITRSDRRTHSATLRFEKTAVFLESGGKRSKGRWNQLTFSDEPAKNLAGRFSQEGWPLHDKKTGYWTDDGLHTEELDRESAAGPSPMFFEKRQNSLQYLRYSTEAFFRFGYPISALLRSFEDKPSKRGHYAIAAPAEAGGFWIEICPGRICEVPAQLLVLLAGGSEVSLANLEWRLFSAGDEVTLRLRADRSLSADKVELVRWVPRGRGGYGKSRLFLPLQPFDAENGCQPLGHSGFRIDLPMNEPPPFHGTAILAEPNQLFPLGNSTPMYGDSVLLELDSSERVRVAGLPGYNPLPDRQSESAWANDPLQPLAETRLSSLVRACGGGLPVTVELCLPEKKMLFFSRRLQRTGGQLEPGKLAAGFVRGLMPDGVTALIQIGAAIRPVAIPRLIPGLPPERCGKVVEKLHNVPLWFHQTAENLEFGISEERSNEFQCELLLKADEGNARTQGFVCRSIDSLRLYWLGALEAAWTRIEGSDLDLIGKKKGSVRLVHVALAVRANAPAGVSMIRTAAAKREFKDSSVGRELIVTPVAGKATEGRRSDLAYSETTGLLLSCENTDDWKSGNSGKLRVEVVTRRDGEPRQITVVPFGKRLHIVNLPNLLLSPPEGIGFTSFVKAWGEPPGRSLVHLDKYSADSLPAALAVACRFSAREVRDVKEVRRLRDIADDWWIRNQSATEIQPHLALSAMLIFDALGGLSAKELSLQTPNYTVQNWYGTIRKMQKTAVTIFQDLALRAAASIHFEVFARYCSTAGRSALGEDFERRFGEVYPSLSPRIQLSVVDTVRAFCGAIRLRSDEAAYPLASSLLTAIGDTRELFRLSEDAKDSAPVAYELLAMYRTVPRSANGSLVQLPAGHRRRAQSLLDRMVHQKLNLVFGPPMASRIQTEDAED